MKISRPEIMQRQDEMVHQVLVDSKSGKQTLWYSLPKEFSHLLTTSNDAALVALLIPAMASGEDIDIDGAISEKLWHNLSGPYQRLLQLVMPGLHRVLIHPNELHAQEKRAAGVATGFSGGIDSFCTIMDYHYAEVPANLKLTHLLFNNVGAHFAGGERLFRERYVKLKPVTEKLGLPFIMLNSNLDSFYHRGIGFRRTYSHRNVSVSLLLQSGISSYLHSSGYSYADVLVGADNDSARCDPVFLPLLSTEVADNRSVGSEYTRVEKTLRVAVLPESYDSLEVCLQSEQVGNCGRCSKCLRTLVTMEIAGIEHKYASLFDLEAYQRQRNVFLAKIRQSPEPFDREIVQFAKHQNYSFPFWTQLAEASQ